MPNNKYFDVTYAQSETEMQENERLLGMFIAWAMQRGLASRFAETEFPGTADRVLNREDSGGLFFAELCSDVCCGKLTNEDLNEVGNAFAADYCRVGKVSKSFFQDAGKVIRFLPDGEDSWSVFDRYATILDKRFAAWRKPWWKLW